MREREFGDGIGRAAFRRRIAGERKMAPDASLHPSQFAFAFRPSERLDGAASPLRPRFSRKKNAFPQIFGNGRRVLPPNVPFPEMTFSGIRALE